MDPIEEAEAIIAQAGETADETAGAIPEDVVQEFMHGRGLTPEEEAEAQDAMQHAWEGTREALEAHGYQWDDGPTPLRGMLDGCFLTPDGAVIGVTIEWLGKESTA
jgi:hypothetical protein